MEVHPTGALSASLGGGETGQLVEISGEGVLVVEAALPGDVGQLRVRLGEEVLRLEQLQPHDLLFRAAAEHLPVLVPQE